MGETKPSSGDGNSRFMKWWMGGSNKRSSSSSSSRPLPVNSDDDEEKDEEIDDQEDDEESCYGLEDTRKPKLAAVQGPKNPAGPIRGKDRPMDISQGARSKTNLCAGCELDIKQGTSREFNGVFFHPQCFCCHTCGRQIADHEPSLSQGGHPHHKSCCEASRHQTCDVCHQPLPMNRLGRLEYVNGRFWSQKYCQQHDFDNTSRCWCCTRLQPRGVIYISFADGRILCLECRSSSVMVNEECQLLYRNVKGFLEEMNMFLDRPVFVHLVDKTALIQAVMQRGINPTAIDISCAFRRTLDITFRRTLDITILLLYGSPRLMLGCRLIEVLTRQWMKQRGYLLPHELEVATGGLVSYWWLECRIKSMASSSNKGLEWEADMKLSKFLMFGFFNDECPIRRRAFCSTKIAVDKYGLHQTLQYATIYKFLPQ